MTEDQIERTAEGMMNALDRKLPSMLQSEYDAAVKKIDAWVQQQYKTMKKGSN